MSAMGGKRTLCNDEWRNTLGRMNWRGLMTMTLTASLLCGCSYRAETLPRCFNENIGPSVRAIEEVTGSGAYRGGIVELLHTLCSTHNDRLDIPKATEGERLGLRVPHR